MLARWPVDLQGVPQLKGYFLTINDPRPLILPKKNDFLSSFGQILFSSLSNFFPKHIKTSSNTLDSHLFFTIFKVVFLHPIFLSLIPYLGFEVQGCGCSFLTTIYTFFSLLLFLASFCLMKYFICFSWHVLAS